MPNKKEPSSGRTIPYGRQWIDDDDVKDVVEAIKSDWLTTGPAVERFEQALAEEFESTYGVAVSSGTAALHCAMFALGIESDDEVIVPTMTFAATANCVVYQGGRPVFVDVNPETLLIDCEEIEAKITRRTKAIIAVDYAGHPCDYDRLHAIADKYSLALVADASHSPGAMYKDRPVGSLAQLSTFSFHPVKHITTGEGGAITTNDLRMANRMGAFRNHGITTDFRERARTGSWYYEMHDLGFNYRLTDFQCALGLSQLKKLPGWIERRQEIASLYDSAFSSVSSVRPLHVSPDITHAYHLYVVRIDPGNPAADRDAVFTNFRAIGIGVNVHYIPVHLHPYYRDRFGTKPGMCPVAEKAYTEILSLPIFPRMTKQEVIDVIAAVRGICA
jgi:UDP-4-amino-4,6-dideoxy-N-acetyl-beta-L-altrosamine transaminase